MEQAALFSIINRIFVPLYSSLLTDTGHSQMQVFNDLKYAHNHKENRTEAMYRGPF